MLKVMEFMVLVYLFICRSDEVEEIDGAVLSSNTILRGVTGRDLLEELQVTCSLKVPSVTKR